VSELLQKGGNAVGAILGNGWWSSGLGWAGGQERHAQPGENLRFLMQLEIECIDGSKHVVVTNESWTSHPSPILDDTLYHGEKYDARLDQPGWDTVAEERLEVPGFYPVRWKPVKVIDVPLDSLCTQKAPPPRITQQLRPIKITEPKPGVYVLDFGQNHSGRPRLTVHVPAGTKITSGMRKSWERTD